ncbi:putative membrane protein [Thermacetogenium phaeum DSM 12270]|uniref:Putative membrane protein n=1 Tax=Thermacetogenium phaeum (strain ATCC BAA-254 / DSM 26808 / PB) TaxID=1089553 RepID=K4LF01_THEPS|nr:hypothetical protein [Thermacetogenium phaeum]AFV11413.1 putative membrane protein [Thermacetogenium phaeum DSM 12270]MDN5366312.1 hypothetical protein [Thermacetogenium sp.]
MLDKIRRYLSGKGDGINADAAGSCCPGPCGEIHSLAASLPRYDWSFKRKDIPANGIYLFYEKGENRSDGTQRIVRVGTHAADGRLPGRLIHHYRGNRYSSVFRWHLGRALLRLQNAPRQVIETWEIKNGPKMPEVEDLVSRYMSSSFQFSCLAVPDKDERLKLEAWLIFILSTCSSCSPSAHWLGLWSPEALIRNSGLWNVDHVPAFVGQGTKLRDRFEELIERQLKGVDGR